MEELRYTCVMVMSLCLYLCLCLSLSVSVSLSHSLLPLTLSLPASPYSLPPFPCPLSLLFPLPLPPFLFYFNRSLCTSVLKYCILCVLTLRSSHLCEIILTVKVSPSTVLMVFHAHICKDKSLSSKNGWLCCTF